jgi:hypothetical protein
MTSRGAARPRLRRLEVAGQLKGELVGGVEGVEDQHHCRAAPNLGVEIGVATGSVAVVKGTSTRNLVQRLLAGTLMERRSWCSSGHDTSKIAENEFGK